MIKTWEVRAEVNMDASHYETITVKANTMRKARIFAQEKFKNLGYFFVTNMSVMEVK